MLCQNQQPTGFQVSEVSLSLRDGKRKHRQSEHHASSRSSRTYCTCDSHVTVSQSYSVQRTGNIRNCWSSSTAFSFSYATHSHAAIVALLVLRFLDRQTDEEYPGFHAVDLVSPFCTESSMIERSVIGVPLSIQVLKRRAVPHGVSDVMVPVADPAKPKRTLVTPLDKHLLQSGWTRF